jgi:hypothetical protein
MSKGRRHDFRVYKESGVQIKEEIEAYADTAYIGLKKYHLKTIIPKKKSKKNPLTKEDKRENRRISRFRVVVENVIGKLKRFHIISHRYRNRRKRFGLRFNLIAAIYNFEL